MKHQKEDIVFGNESEVKNLAILSTFVGSQLNRTKMYSIFDYTDESNTIFVELKTRRINHDQYPTAIIGKNKVDYCSDPTKKYYFCFCYNDGLYTIQYDPKVFEEFEVESNFYRSPRYGCVNRPQTLVHIPTSHLRLLASSRSLALSSS